MTRRLLVTGAVAAALGLGGWAIVERRAGSAGGSAFEERWGVAVQGVRLSAGGYMLDFRYRVLDGEKARALVDRRVRPYLVDETSGARLMVPAPPKIGPLRPSVRHGPPKEGRTYFVLFANPGGLVRQGQRVSVVIGNFRATGLTVG